MADAAYDVIWCTPEHARRAMGLLRQLSHTEIILRGIDGMHGVRVNPKAPMPRDAQGSYAGDVGCCLMPNWLGSEALAACMGEVVTPHDDQPQHVNMASICKSIEILERGEKGETILAGGMFAPGIEDSPDVVRCVAIQAKREQHAREQGEAIDAKFLEVLAAKALVRWTLPTLRLLRWMHDILWRRWVSRPLAILCSFAMIVVGLLFYLLPLAYVGARARARKVRRAARLLLPFDPYLEAMQVLSGTRYRS